MRVIQIFFKADLRCQHDGLAQIAKLKGVDVTKIKPGEFVVFVNAAKNRLKLFAANGVVAAWRARAGQEINMLAIAEIPAAFAATGELKYSDALKAAIEKQLAKKEEKKK